jgi:hypothetical protein
MGTHHWWNEWNDAEKGEAKYNQIKSNQISPNANFVQHKSHTDLPVIESVFSPRKSSDYPSQPCRKANNYEDDSSNKQH